jgi:hypothetical protein
MAEHANSTPVPHGQIVPFPRACEPPFERGRLRAGDALPANVAWLRAPYVVQRDFTPTSILLGAIVSTLTPRQFTKLTGDLRDRWQAGDHKAMAALSLGVEGAYVQ